MTAPRLENNDSIISENPQSSALAHAIPDLYSGFSQLSSKAGTSDNLMSGTSLDFTGQGNIYPGDLQSTLQNSLGQAQSTATDATSSSTPAGGDSSSNMATVLQTIEQELTQILSLLEGGSASGGSGGTSGGDGGGTSGGGSSNPGEVPTPSTPELPPSTPSTPGEVSGGGQLYNATGTDVAPIATVTNDPGDGSTVITGFNTPATHTDLNTSGNTNTDALVALQQIGADAQYSAGSFSGQGIDVSQEMSGGSGSPGYAAIQQLETASGDSNFVNDFVNDVNQDVLPVGNAGIEGASSRWNSNQTLGYPWMSGEDPFQNLPEALQQVQQQNPGLTGSALVQAVVQNMGSQFSQSVSEQAQQAADTETPFINH